MTVKNRPIGLMAGSSSGPSRGPSRNRRLSKDYEFRLATSEAWVYLSMIRVMLRRLAHERIEPAFHYRRVA